MDGANPSKKTVTLILTLTHNQRNSHAHFFCLCSLAPAGLPAAFAPVVPELLFAEMLPGFLERERLISYD